MDFPLAYGQIIPATDPAAIARINQRRDAQALSDVSAGQIWLHMAHRFGALVISLTITLFWFLVRREDRNAPAVRGLSSLWLGLVIVQIILGAWTIWSNKAADIATAHVAVGAATFAVGILVSAVLLRLHDKNEAAPPARLTIKPEAVTAR
jgi:cytochrome c oxidase assembly protein subunit 15